MLRAGVSIALSNGIMFIGVCSLRDFPLFISLYISKFSKALSFEPFFSMCRIFIMSSIGPKLCPLSMTCLANCESFLLSRKDLWCSWNLFLKVLPVCPIYVSLHEHRSSYTPLLSYILCVSMLDLRSLPRLFLVLYATFKPCFLKIFAILYVSLPLYVNVTHLSGSVFRFWCISCVY